MTHIVMIGAGQAGSSAAFKLRTLGFDGDVTLIGRRLIEAGKSPDPTAVADPQTDLKSLM